MKEKREIPRHLDEGIKIFSVMPIKNLLFVSPVIAGLGGIALLKPSPFSLFSCGIGASLTVILGCEFHRETGLEILKSIIEYEKNGDVVFDRSTELVPIERRFINRDIKEDKQC